MHESRIGFTMLSGCLYLLIVGAGPWSLDALKQNEPPRLMSAMKSLGRK